MKKIITYGTFDLMHRGHINILRRAKELGDFLVVGLSTDEFNSKKDKKSFFNFNDRKLILESIKYVDLVIEEKDWLQKESDIQKHNISVFVMGDDWDGKFDFLKSHCQVVYLERTKDISTSKIKMELGKQTLF
jgi:glycerol-3-phosphate cytidylyltransferase